MRNEIEQAVKATLDWAVERNAEKVNASMIAQSVIQAIGQSNKMQDLDGLLSALFFRHGRTLTQIGFREEVKEAMETIQFFSRYGK